VKVDDLLANIRRSVDTDLDTLNGGTTSQSRGTLMRGALREMRINMGVDPDPKPKLPEGLGDLRTRIKQKVDRAAVEHFEPPPPSRQANPGRGDFSGIMSRPAAPQYEQDLRPSFDDEPQDDVRYAAPHQPQRWQDEAPRYDHQQPDPYAQADVYGQPDYGYQHPYVPPALEGPLMSRQSEAQTESAFQQLSDALLARATGDRSLEDMTRDMLRTMLKQWLDANLPAIVEDMVREEIQRVARRGR
jgi:uncharacterized protein